MSEYLKKILLPMQNGEQAEVKLFGEEEVRGILNDKVGDYSITKASITQNKNDISIIKNDIVTIKKSVASNEKNIDILSSDVQTSKDDITELNTIASNLRGNSYYFSYLGALTSYIKAKYAEDADPSLWFYESVKNNNIIKNKLDEPNFEIDGIALLNSDIDFQRSAIEEVDIRLDFSYSTAYVLLANTSYLKKAKIRAAIGHKFFRLCSSLEEIELELHAKGSCEEMFLGCEKLRQIDLSRCSFRHATNMSSMFSRCSSITELDLSNFDTSNVKYMSSMFIYCTSLTHLDLSNFDTSKVKNLSGIFYGCSSLTKLDISNFDTSNATDINSIFDGCTSLAELDVSSFDTSNVTNMSSMFKDCSSLAELDVSNFDTSNVEFFWATFAGCSSLTYLDVSNFDTSKVKMFTGMFSRCTSLTHIDLSNFDTSKTTSIERMFGTCISLVSLDLSGFNTNKVDNMDYVFIDCSSLETLKISNFNICSKHSSIFSGCTSLSNVIGSTSITTSLYIGDSPLTNDSAMVFIIGLTKATTAKTITFSATTYDTLTEEQIAVATSRGWTVVRGS